MGFHLQLWILVLPMFWLGSLFSLCTLSNHPLRNYTEKGHITLGMINSVTKTSTPQISTFSDRSPPHPCDLFRPDLYKSILVLLFAVKEVNENQDLLPNVTLGFQMFDSCFSEATSLQAIFQMTSVSGSFTPNYKCGAQPIVPAVIGDLSSSSIAIARVLGLWKIPQVSYVASVPSLSSKVEFPSFLRTMASDKSQLQALIELCKKFGWTWVGFLISPAENYKQGAADFKRKAIKDGICVAFTETVSSDFFRNEIKEILKKVERSSAKVVILYCSPVDVDMIFINIHQQSLNGKIWIGIEACYSTPMAQHSYFRRFLNGTMGVTRSRRILPNFSKFLHSLHPYTYSRMFFIYQYWEKLFSCKWSPLSGNSSIASGSSTFTHTCTGLEKLVMDDVSDLSFQSVYNAHNALYAIVHALHNLLSCKPGEGPFHGHKCAEEHDIQPWQLLYYLKRVHFVNTAGEEVSFNTNGNIHGYFDILNCHQKDNNVEYVKVGSFNNKHGDKLTINDTIIIWAGGQVPSSVCSDNCPPGYWMVPQRGQSFCCFDCYKCPEGMFSNQTNSPVCFLCPEDQRPNKRRTKCLPKMIEFLSYEDPLGQILATFCIVFSVTTMMVLCIFIKFRNTAVVKANNRNLSYVLLLSLMFCFLCSLTFIGCPGSLACIIRQSLFGITFSLCISCILAKTITVTIAFKATKPGSKLRLWARSKTAILVVTSTTSVQALIVLVWILTFPPSVLQDFHDIPGTIILECDENSVFMFYCNIGYLAFLALLSIVVAFLAKNLPDSFNEAKYIIFSMLTFISVWSIFITTHVSTKGKYIVVVEIFAILLSSLGLLCCIFGPKCYTILLKPLKKTHEHVMVKFR